MESAGEVKHVSWGLQIGVGIRKYSLDNFFKFTNCLTEKAYRSFPLDHTHSVTPVACGLGVLALNMKTPEVAHPSVDLNFLQPHQVFTKVVVQTTGQNLAVLSILHVLLSVQEPDWNLVLAWILHNGGRVFHLILSELSCPLGEVDVCFLQHHTLNCSDGKGYFLLFIDTGVVLIKCAEISQQSLEIWQQQPCGRELDKYFERFFEDGHAEITSSS